MLNNFNIKLFLAAVICSSSGLRPVQLLPVKKIELVRHLAEWQVQNSALEKLQRAKGHCSTEHRQLSFTYKLMLNNLKIKLF